MQSSNCKYLIKAKKLVLEKKISSIQSSTKSRKVIIKYYLLFIVSINNIKNKQKSHTPYDGIKFIDIIEK